VAAIEHEQDEAPVRLYLKPDCRYCDYAKELFTERGVRFREIDVNDDFVLRGWLAWATGQRTLPQIFIDGEPIGGFADLMTMDATGELKRRVAAAIEAQRKRSEIGQ